MNTCLTCTSEFESAEGGFTEWGLVCGHCAQDYQLIPTHYTNDSGGLGKAVALNAVGIGLAAVTGIGFTYRGKGEPPPIPEPERRRMFRARVAQRIARDGVRRAPRLLLRRGTEEFGPYKVAELAQLWTEGRVLPTDDYRYEGTSDWAPVTSFKPRA